MIMPIIQHELRLFFSKAKAWYSLAALQFILSLIFNLLINNFLKNQIQAGTLHFGITEEVLHPFYAWFALILILILPTHSTQMLCTEKNNDTMVNYYCNNVSAMQFILGKYISLNIKMLLALSFISIMPLSIIMSGSLDWGQFFATLIGVYLVLSAAIGLSFCIAAFMQNVIRCNILILITIFSAIMLEWGAQFMGQHAFVLQNFGLLKPLKGFLAGTINSNAIAYYALIILSTLWLSNLGYKRQESC